HAGRGGRRPGGAVAEGASATSSGWPIGKTSRRFNDAIQLRMSARRLLLLPVAGYDATFSPWLPSGPPRVSPLLRRSGTARRHNDPVFQTNMANEAHCTRNRSPDRF